MSTGGKTTSQIRPSTASSGQQRGAAALGLGDDAVSGRRVHGRPALGAAILEAGYTKIYCLNAVVRHSHRLRRGCHAPAARVRRVALLPGILQRPERPRREAVVSPHEDVLWTVRDLKQLWADERSTRAEKLSWASRAFPRYGAEAVGRYLGDRSQVIPNSIVRRISQHHELKGDVHHEAEGDTSTLQLLRARIGAARPHLSKLDFAVQTVRKTLWDSRDTCVLARPASHAVVALRAMRRPHTPHTGRAWWESQLYKLIQANKTGTWSGPPVKRRGPAADRLMMNWVIPSYGEPRRRPPDSLSNGSPARAPGPPRAHLRDGWKGHEPTRSRACMRAEIHQWFRAHRCVDAPPWRRDGTRRRHDRDCVADGLCGSKPAPARPTRRTSLFKRLRAVVSTRPVPSRSSREEHVPLRLLRNLRPWPVARARAHHAVWNECARVSARGRAPGLLARAEPAPWQATHLCVRAAVDRAPGLRAGRARAAPHSRAAAPRSRIHTAGAHLHPRGSAGAVREPRHL